MAERRNLITTKQALERGLFKSSKLYLLINDGTIIAYKNGSRTMIDADSLDRYETSLPRVMPKKKAGG